MTPSSGITGSEPAAPVVDLEGLIRRCGGDAELAGIILAEFQRSCSALQLRLDESLSPLDADRLGETLHAISGVVANVGGGLLATRGIALRRRVATEDPAALGAEIAAWRRDWLLFPAAVADAVRQIGA